jgi:CheY-like chemotaxis protein
MGGFDAGSVGEGAMAERAERPQMTVMIVDDDEDLLIIASHALRKEEGLRIYTAEDGATAIGLLPYLKPDLILLDIMMPRVSGYDVLDHLQAGEFSKIPVIVITGILSRSGPVETLQKYKNVVRILEKPVATKRLREAVCEALALSVPKP